MKSAFEINVHYDYLNPHLKNVDFTFIFHWAGVSSTILNNCLYKIGQRTLTVRASIIVQLASSFTNLD